MKRALDVGGFANVRNVLTRMPLLPIFSGFNYVAVDAQRCRVYAAHTASEALTIVHANTGSVA